MWTIEVDSQKQPHGCCGNGRATAEFLNLPFRGPSGGGLEEGLSHCMGPPPEPTRTWRKAPRGGVGKGGERWRSAAQALASPLQRTLPPRAVGPDGGRRARRTQSKWPSTPPLSAPGRGLPIPSPAQTAFPSLVRTPPAPKTSRESSPKGSLFLAQRPPSMPHPPVFPPRSRSRSPAAASLQPRMLTQAQGGLY